MRTALAAAVLLLVPALTCLGDDEHMHDHHLTEGASANEPTIKITINPEARVGVTLAGALPQSAPCGTVTELRVKIVNQGFVTAPLEARLIDSTPEDVAMEFPAEPLKGIREEHRVLRLTLKKPGPLDVTVAFRAKDGLPDLGGRDRVHFLMSCQETH